VPRLWQINYEAWELYQFINSQFVYDFHALPLVFEILKPRWSRAEAVLMLEKLIIIHAELTKREEDA